MQGRLHVNELVPIAVFGISHKNIIFIRSCTNPVSIKNVWNGQCLNDWNTDMKIRSKHKNVIFKVVTPDCDRNLDWGLPHMCRQKSHFQERFYDCFHKTYYKTTKLTYATRWSDFYAIIWMLIRKRCFWNEMRRSL